MTTQVNENGTVALYFASWCGFSRDILNKDWPEVFAKGQHDPKYANIKFEQICCEGGNQSMCQIVRGYPTILFTKYNGDDVVMEEYMGNRSSSDILANVDKFFGL